MFNIKQNGTNRLDIELSGKLEADEMKVALDELISQSQGIRNGRMLYEIHEFRIPSLGALAVEFTRLPELFGLIKRFDRAAVLADEEWIRKISELENKLFPGLEIRAFERDERAEAEAWLER